MDLVHGPWTTPRGRVYASGLYPFGFDLIPTIDIKSDGWERSERQGRRLTATEAAAPWPDLTGVRHGASRCSVIGEGNTGGERGRPRTHHGGSQAEERAGEGAATAGNDDVRRHALGTGLRCSKRRFVGISVLWLPARVNG